MRKFIFLIIMSLILIGCSDQNHTDDAAHEKPPKIKKEEKKLEAEEGADNQLESESVEGKNDATIAEEEQSIVYTYLENKESFSLNKYDTTLFETEEGQVTLVGKEFFDNTITLALTYEGELSDIWDNIEPRFRFITDEGDAYTDYSKEHRLSEDGKMYVIYTFDNVQGSEIKRFDYIVDSTYQPETDEYETIELQEETDEEIEIPGMAQYTSSTYDFNKLRDDTKEVAIKNMSYDSEDGRIELTADVTYRDDYDEEEQSFVYEPITKSYASDYINEDFYADVTKEITLSYDIGTLSQHTPHVRLRLYDFTLYLDLLAEDDSDLNHIELVEMNHEERLYNQFLFQDLEAIPYLTHVDLPIIDEPMEDTQGNIYYDGFYANMTGRLFQPETEDGNDYTYAEGYRFDTDGFQTFRGTLAFSKETEDFSPITFTFIGDDFEYTEDEYLISQTFKGTVLEEVTVSAKDGAKDVSVKLDDTKNLTILVSSLKDGKLGTPTFIIANNLLK